MNILAVSTTAILLSGVINIVIRHQEKQSLMDKERNQLFIEHNSKNYIEIYKLFLKYPKELGDLFYEFYGSVGFPKRNTESKQINRYEYIVINIIIENLITMFIIDNDIFQNLQFRNRISSFVRSKKFVYVLSNNKGNYPSEFIKKLLDENLILPKDLQLENVNIIYKVK